MPKTPQILIVDEDLDSRVETRRALQRARLDIAGEVGLGAEAISYATEVLPAAILLAVEEPVTRSLETAESLANVLPQTPIIFYSSLTDPEAIRRALLSGARDYVTKPVQAFRIRDAVMHALEYEEKRQMREAGQLAGAAVRGTVIIVTGAKGGIGKSIISVNLALALRQSLQRKVVLVDADTQFGDVATMLDLKPEVTASEVLDHLDNVDRWKIAEYLTTAQDGLLVLAPPKEEGTHWDDKDPGSLKKIIDVLSLNHDFVIVDTSGSFDRYTQAAIEASTFVLVVTTGEVSSVRDTKAALQRLEKWGIPPEKVKLVLNRGVRVDGVQAADLEESLRRKLFWELPRDKFVPLSVQLGEPVVAGRPKSAASRSISALAKAIGGTPTEPAHNAPKRPLLAALRPRRRDS